MERVHLPSGGYLEERLAEHIATRRARPAPAPRNARLAIDIVEHEPVPLVAAIDAMNDIIRREKTSSPLQNQLTIFRNTLEQCLTEVKRDHPGQDPAEFRIGIDAGGHDSIVEIARDLVNHRKATRTTEPRVLAVAAKLYKLYIDQLRGDSTYYDIMMKRRRTAERSPTQKSKMLKAQNELSQQFKTMVPDDPAIATRQLKRILAECAVFTDRYGEPDYAQNAEYPISNDEGNNRVTIAKLHELLGRYVISRLKERGIVQPLNLHDRAEFTPGDALAAKALQISFIEARTAFAVEPSLANWTQLLHATEKRLMNGYAMESEGWVGICTVMLDSGSPYFRYQLQRIAQFQKTVLQNQKKADALAQAMAVKTARPARVIEKHATSPQASNGRANAPLEAPTDEVQVPVSALQTRIMTAARSHFAPVALEGEAARTISENFSFLSSIIGFNQVIKGASGNTIGEYDIQLEDVIVECTLRPSGKNDQLRKYLTNKSLNPHGKAVVLYAPNYRSEAERSLPREVQLARTPEKLGTALFAIKGMKLGWASRSPRAN